MRSWSLHNVRDRILWIPRMGDPAEILVAALRASGLDARLLASSPDPLLRLARSVTDGDQCLPSILTTEDILQRTRAAGFEPGREAFFQARAEGPCRMGRYYMNQQLILARQGLGEVPIFDFDVDNPDCYRILGGDFRLSTIDALSAHAALEAWLHRSRPIERVAGEAWATYRAALDRLCAAVETHPRRGRLRMSLEVLAGRHSRHVFDLLPELRRALDRVETGPDRRPRVLVTGELYVRLSQVANQDVIRRIEDHGGTAVLEPVTVFFAYNQLLPVLRAGHHVRRASAAQALGARLELGIAERDGRRIHRALGVAPPPRAAELVALGRRFVHPAFEGEALVTLGAIAHAARDGMAGVVNVMPHNCMPGLISSALARQAARTAGRELPVLHLSYDGHLDAGREEHLGIFMAQVSQPSSRPAASA